MIILRMKPKKMKNNKAAKLDEMAIEVRRAKDLFWSLMCVRIIITGNRGVEGECAGANLQGERGCLRAETNT